VALAAQLYGPNPVPEQTLQLPVQSVSFGPQLKAVPEPEHCSQLPVVSQRFTLAAQLYAVPEPEQVLQLPVQTVALAAQLPEVQTLQLPVQSEATSVQVPRKPATLHRLQLPSQVVLQHTPSTHKPDVHWDWIESVQGCPGALPSSKEIAGYA
jgi:hypothetical protein